MDIRIYYEDTDAAGVVYHANYLRYFERARTEYLRERGISVSSLAVADYIFPVVRMEIDFKAPGHYDDLISIKTIPVRVGGSSFALRQQALRASDNKLLADALVTLACVSSTIKARRLPVEVRQLLGSVCSQQKI